MGCMDIPGLACTLDDILPPAKLRVIMKVTSQCCILHRLVSSDETATLSFAMHSSTLKYMVNLLIDNNLNTWFRLEKSIYW